MKKLMFACVLVVALSSCKGSGGVITDAAGAVADSAPQAGLVIKDAVSGNWAALGISITAFLASVATAYGVRKKKRDDAAVPPTTTPS